MMNTDSDKTSNWGGSRPGAGNKYKWRHGQTKAVRIPISIADEVLEVAKAIDAGTPPTDYDCVTQSLSMPDDEVEMLKAISQKYSSEIGELKTRLAKLSHQLEQVTKDRDKYFDQIADIRLELDNLKDDNVTHSSGKPVVLDDSVTQSRLDLPAIRDRILLRHPPAKRRELKKALDQFIGELND